MGLYISLINAYDALAESGATVCPIAHTYMTVHIAVLLNKKGEFLCAKTPDIKGELVRVPCTDESERAEIVRTCCMIIYVMLPRLGQNQADMKHIYHSSKNIQKQNPKTCMLPRYIITLKTGIFCMI